MYLSIYEFLHSCFNKKSVIISVTIILTDLIYTWSIFFIKSLFY